MTLPSNLPKEFGILSFLPQEKYQTKWVQGVLYTIIGWDDVGNEIGMTSQGTLYYLVRMEEDSSVQLHYIAPDMDCFCQEILCYHRFAAGSLSHEEEPWKEEERFRQMILAIDPKAFDEEDSFWSSFAEEIGYGL